jgi:hypothetical protein
MLWEFFETPKKRGSKVISIKTTSMNPTHAPSSRPHSIPYPYPKGIIKSTYLLIFKYLTYMAKAK